jgi:peptidoglycan/xylan/chitin deacetylase (PgdA/CDA1 family)
MQWSIRGALGGMLSPSLTILCFHRVMRAPHHWERVFPDEKKFDWQMRSVQSVMPILPLRDALDQLFEGRLKRPAAVITFDDGYADNFEVAFPILKRLNIPATFFVSTAYVGSDGLFGEKLREAFHTAPNRHVDLTDLGLPMVTLGSAEERQQGLTKVKELVKYLPPVARDEKTEQVLKRIGGQVGRARMLDDSQIRKMAKAGMEFGSHSHRHVILPTVSHKELLDDVRQSLDTLQDILGERVNTFAYPNGKVATDYKPEHFDLLRSLGLKTCLTTNIGLVTPKDSLMALPRMTPWDNSSWRFRARLVKELLRVRA